MLFEVWGCFFCSFSDTLTCYTIFFNVKISEIFHRCLGMPRNIPFKCLIGHCWLPQAIYFSALGPQKLIPQLVSFLLLDSVLSSKYTHSFVFSLVKQLPTTLQNHRDEKVVLVVHTGMFVTQASVLCWTLVNTLFPWSQKGVLVFYLISTVFALEAERIQWTAAWLFWVCLVMEKIRM